MTTQAEFLTALDDQSQNQDSLLKLAGSLESLDATTLMKFIERRTKMQPVLKALLPKTKDLSQQDDTGCTAFHKAIMLGLGQYAATIAGACNEAGITKYWASALTKKVGEHEKGDTPLITSIYGDRDENLKALILKDADNLSHALEPGKAYKAIFDKKNNLHRYVGSTASNKEKDDIVTCALRNGYYEATGHALRSEYRETYFASMQVFIADLIENEDFDTADKILQAFSGFDILKPFKDYYEEKATKLRDSLTKSHSESLAGAAAEHAAEKEALEGQLKEAKTSIASLEESLEAERSEKKEALKEVALATAKIERTESALQQERDKNKQAEIKLAENKRSLAMLTTAETTQNETIGLQQKTIDELDAQIASLKKSSQDEKSDHEEQVSDLKATKEYLEKQHKLTVEELNDKIEELQQNLEKNNTQYTKNVSRLQGQLEAAEALVTKRDEVIATLSSQKQSAPAPAPSPSSSSTSAASEEEVAVARKEAAAEGIGSMFRLPAAFGAGIIATVMFLKPIQKFLPSLTEPPTPQ